MEMIAGLGLTGVIGLAVVGFTLVGVLAYFGHKAAKQRRADLLALSGRYGMSFDPSHDRGFEHRYSHFEVFTRGFGRSAYNTMRGEVEVGGRAMGCVMGDYTYKTREGSGKNRRTVTHRFSYCILEMPWNGMPGLLIRREHFFDKLGSAFGFDDIDFESNEFSKKYFVKSANRKFAYDICHPRMIEWLLETQATGVDIEQGRMCVTDGSRVWKVDQFVYTLEWMDRFVERWPAFVIEDLEEGILI